MQRGHQPGVFGLAAASARSHGVLSAVLLNRASDFVKKRAPQNQLLARLSHILSDKNRVTKRLLARCLGKISLSGYTKTSVKDTFSAPH